jgi:hypothetical protein
VQCRTACKADALVAGVEKRISTYGGKPLPWLWCWMEPGIKMVSVFAMRGKILQHSKHGRGRIHEELPPNIPARNRELTNSCSSGSSYLQKALSLSRCLRWG